MDYTHHTAHGAYYITSCLAHTATQGEAGNTRLQSFYLFCKINGACSLQCSSPLAVSYRRYEATLLPIGWRPRCLDGQLVEDNE